MRHTKLLAIAATAAILVWVAFSILFAPEFLVLGAVAIPIMTLAGFSALVFFDTLFSKWPALRRWGYILGLVGGAIGGAAFYGLWFSGLEYLSILAAQYSGLGAAVGLCTAFIYFRATKNA